MEPPSPDRPIALIGLPASGKTSVARILSALLRLPGRDLDDLIEEEAGMDIPSIFAAEKESGFRLRESRALGRAAGEGIQVLATGGGIVISPDNRRTLRERFLTVWLRVSPEVAAARSEGGRRPLLAGGNAEEKIRRLQSEREALYAECADLRVDTDLLGAREVAKAIHDMLP